MTLALFILVLILGGTLGGMYHFMQRAQKAAVLARAEVDEIRRKSDGEIAKAHTESEAAAARAQAALDQKVNELNADAQQVREYYEKEVRKLLETATAQMNQSLAELEPLRAYASLRDAENEVRRNLANAIEEATSLKNEAQMLLDQAKNSAAGERQIAQQRAKEISEQAAAMLTQATRDAGRIVAEAETRAQQIGGDAYVALRDKQLLERAIDSMRNIISGYGDRYIIPTHSLLDDLAVEFGYDAAGQSLAAARDQSRRMVEQNEAAACDYVEPARRGTAIRFVIDAFNGRVDAILSRSKHDNYGTLEREIRDAFNLVNLNGQAFKDARILPAYLDARLAELKWAVVVHELARKQKEEQRYLKERLRDEEKARKEYQEKMRRAAEEEEMKRRAVEEAEKKFTEASAEQKTHYEQELQKLRQDLKDASQRALTIAQQTKKGHVYIISNVGAFGEGIYKIGQTRRPDPQDRVDELGSASVPFEFDVHALIETENAPVLEHRIHKQLLELQVNKMNSRKEFFRVTLPDIRREIDKLKQGEDFTIKTWTEKALAAEYRDSLEIEKDPQKKETWIARQRALAERQLRLDTLPLSVQEAAEASEDENAADE